MCAIGLASDGAVVSVRVLEGPLAQEFKQYSKSKGGSMGRDGFALVLPARPFPRLQGSTLQEVGGESEEPLPCNAVDLGRVQWQEAGLSTEAFVMSAL